MSRFVENFYMVEKEKLQEHINYLQYLENLKEPTPTLTDSAANWLEVPGQNFGWVANTGKVICNKIEGNVNNCGEVHCYKIEGNINNCKKVYKA